MSFPPDGIFLSFFALFTTIWEPWRQKSGPKNKKSPSMNKRSNKVLNPTNGPQNQIV